jgi:hypothetical protein
MGTLLEFSFRYVDSSEADAAQAGLQRTLCGRGASYYGSEDDGEARTMRFLFDDDERADAAMAAIDTTPFEIRRHEARVESVDPKTLKPGPIRRDSLPEELAALARFSYQRIGNRIYLAYEQWELGFLRDMNPAGEIALWVRMAFALERYAAAHPEEAADDVFRDLTRLSVGHDDGTPRQEELKALMEAVSREDFEEAVRLGSDRGQ